jgi:dipeptidyl aminopeptidase/acylaminoacyl peptidase
LQTKFEIKVPTNAELAANLKGHLLLVHGEMDNNVHPANTMRLADALIKANKRFDMLILPGKRHGFADYQPYFTQRMWDFFAQHLLDERPTSADIYEKPKGGPRR